LNYLFSFFILFNIYLFAQNKNDLNTTNKLSFFSEEGDIDLSDYMSQAYGFLPIPIIITEPSIGYGGGIALIYLHDTLLGKESSTGRRIPPSISGLLAAATENGTKASGAFHIGYWLEDTLRTATYIGKPDVFIDMYGDNFSFNMNFKGFFFYQSVKKRITNSNIFLGTAYMYLKTDVIFDFDKFEEDFSGESKVASLSFLAEYDSRDNQLSPNRGQFLSFKAQFYNKAFGGDYDFRNYKSTNLFYNKLNSNINLDFNFVAEIVDGDKSEIPSYLYPFISMRGIPMMRYQGEKITTLQSQLSYAFTDRWKGLVFAGIGKAFGKQIISEEHTFSEAENIIAGGIGFRYMLAKKFGLRVGIDIAKSKESEAFYIQVGSAWKGF
jgi:hypothetical protein